MKSRQIIKRGAVGTAPIGPANFGSRILAGAVALLLILALFAGRVWAITGGQVDTNDAYSNVGCVVFVPPPELSPPFVYFSGTLIHPRVLLTAGHTAAICQEIPAVIPNLRVSFGADALDPSTWHEIETGFAHPNYTPLTPNGNARPTLNDVGVIILKEPVYDVPLAKLPYAGLLDDLKRAGLLREPGQGGAPFVVAGYGSTLAWPPPVITGGDGWRRFADSEYLSVLPGLLLLSQNLATGNGGTGYGDSGGPAFWTAPDGTPVLVGITSWGDTECVAMNFYWRADIPATLDFINWVIQGLEP